MAFTREPSGKPGVDQRLALVDPPAHLGHDPLDDRLGHLVGDEPPARLSR